MTIKIVFIVYPDLLREKTVTVVPLFLITVGIGGLVRRVVASLLLSFLLEGNFLELLAKSLLFLPHSVEGRQDLVIVSMHVQRLIGTTVQASTVSLELEALSGIVRVLNGWIPLGAVLAELGRGLARRRGLAFSIWFLLLGNPLAGFHFFLGRLVGFIFTLRVGLLKLLEQLLLTVLVLLDQD